MPGLVPGIYESQLGNVSGGWVNIRYGFTSLVYAERHANFAAAIQREMAIKHWPRAWIAPATDSPRDLDT